MAEDGIWHGGDLATARALFPDAPGPWIDLSTGINPIPYPLPTLPLSLWTRLPGADDEAALIAAARAAYRVPADAGIVAAPGTQILIELLPSLAPASPVAIIGPTYAEHGHAWRKAGFTVDDRQIDLATMFSRRNNKGTPAEGGWNMFLTAFGGDAMMDPLTNPYVTGACEKAFVGWPCDQDLQARWKSFLLADGQAARKDAAVKIQERANEIVTFIPMGQYYGVSGWSKSVSGMIPSPLHLYWNIEKKQ